MGTDDGIRVRDTRTSAQGAGKDSGKDRSRPAGEHRDLARALLSLRTPWDHPSLWEPDDPGHGRPPVEAANKFFLACILDMAIPWERAWANAARLAETTLGDPTDLWNTIVAQFADGAALRAACPWLHFVPAAFDRVVRIGRDLCAQYDGDARLVWEGCTSDEVLRRLTTLRAGDKISRMILGLLLQRGLVQAPCDVKADRHVTRVLGRLLGDPRMTPSGAVEAARSVYPANPWDLDHALFLLGTTVCTKQTPKCADCPVRAVCGSV